jgi:hypothetical protein
LDTFITRKKKARRKSFASLEKRFESHSQLYNDISYLIPEYLNKDVPKIDFVWMSSKLKRFDHNITFGRQNLKISSINGPK